MSCVLNRVAELKKKTFEHVDDPIRPSLKKRSKTNSTGVISDDSFLGKILNPPSTHYHKSKVTPIDNFDFYHKTCLSKAKNDYTSAVNFLKYCRFHGFKIDIAIDRLAFAMDFLNREEDRLEILKKLNEEKLEKEKTKQEKEKEKEKKKEHIPIVNFNSSVKIVRNGKTMKLKPFVYLHAKYYSKNIRPSIEEKVKMYHLLGYPEHFLMKMLSSDEKLRERKKVVEELFVKVFSKYEGKKPSKSKPKSFIQKLRGPKKPVKKEKKEKTKKEKKDEEEPQEEEPEEEEPQEEEPEEEEEDEEEEEEEEE